MKASEMNKAKYWLTTVLKDNDSPTGGVAHENETLLEFLESCSEGNIEEMDMTNVNMMLKECGILPIDFNFTKERQDLAVMAALYVGNLASEIDPMKVNPHCDYDSFTVIYKCVNFANRYDFEMCEECGEWVIDTEVAREDAFRFAEDMIKEILS